MTANQITLYMHFIFILREHMVFFLRIFFQYMKVRSQFQNRSKALKDLLALPQLLGLNYPAESSSLENKTTFLIRVEFWNFLFSRSVAVAASWVRLALNQDNDFFQIMSETLAQGKRINEGRFRRMKN